MKLWMKRILIIVFAIVLAEAIGVLIFAILSFQYDKDWLNLLFSIAEIIVASFGFIFICKYPIEIKINPDEVRKTWKVIRPDDDAESEDENEIEEDF